MAETGKYTFRWEHPAEEVFVTGTFDEWSKSIQLEKNADGVFEKTVDLPKPGEPIFYKFVKDGEWVTSHTAPTETDASGNTNNVLRPSDFLSSAAPAASTAAMAAKVPLQSGGQPQASVSDTPGAFPETPAQETGDFSVNPIPASAGSGNPVNLKPGEPVPPPNTISSNTIQSGVYDDPELKAADEAKSKASEQTFSVNPIPATAGIGNPINLAPGEPVPPASQVTSNTVNSTVKTDKASYENSSALPGAVPQTAGIETDQLAAPPTTGGSGPKIPESGGIPMGADAPSAKEADPGVTIQSAGPQSTTAALAAKVPLEKEKVTGFKGPVVKSSDPTFNTTSFDTSKPTSSDQNGVPEVVTESQKEAHVDPEAAANPEVVKEKSAVEQELLKEVKPTNAAGEPAPTTTAATSAEAPKAHDALHAPEEKAQPVSRDVSPKTNPGGRQTPASGNENKKDEGSIGRRMSAAFKKATGTPESSSKASATTTPASDAKTDKKSKRRSILVKLKEAFK